MDTLLTFNADKTPKCFAPLEDFIGAQGAQGPAGADGADGANGVDGQDGVGGVTTAGTNVTITGAGTAADPYVINAAGGGGGSADGVISGGSLTGSTLTLTRTVGADLTIDVSPLLDNTVTNLGSSVNTADPQNPVVTVTSSDGTNTTFTIPIPTSGGTSSITNLSHNITGTNVEVVSSDGTNTTIPMTTVINNFFAALPNCT